MRKKPKKKLPKTFMGNISECGEVCSMVLAGTDDTGEIKSEMTSEVRSHLRYLAAQQYITGNETLSELGTKPKFRCVSRSIEGWSRKDRWVDRRQGFRENVQTMVEKKMAAEQANLRIESLKTGKTIGDRLQALILNTKEGEGEILKPKSLEGAVNAWIKVTTLTDEMREKLLDYLTAANGQPQGEIQGEELKIEKRQPVLPVRPNLSEEEARMMAKTLIKSRRDKARLEVQKKKDFEDANPQVVGILKK